MLTLSFRESDVGAKDEFVGFHSNEGEILYDNVQGVITNTGPTTVTPDCSITTTSGTRVALYGDGGIFKPLGPLAVGDRKARILIAPLADNPLTEADFLALAPIEVSLGGVAVATFSLADCQALVAHANDTIGVAAPI